ncbi:MAG: thioredoxin family protein [Planctomycetes bacterium]|nr:thioredoxin family protein [Planctomycetota bacterium]
MEIKVIGPGCSRCRTAMKLIESVVAERAPGVRVSKVEDLTEMIRLGLMSTPAVLVDGRVVLSGRVPSRAEIESWLAPAPTERT